MKKYGWKCGKSFVEGDFERQQSVTETSLDGIVRGERAAVCLIACLLRAMRVTWTEFREESQT